MSDHLNIPPGPEVSLYCALDWGRQDHCFVLKDPQRKVLAKGYFSSSRPGFEDFLSQLDAHRQGRPVALILEAHRGAPLQALLDIDWLVLCPVNPVKTRKLIELEGSGLGKSDPRDCHLLCDYLISHYDRLTRSIERDCLFRTLQILVISEEELVAEQTRLINRAKDLIFQVCPELLTIAGELHRSFAQAYLLQFSPLAPAPSQAVLELLEKHQLRCQALKEAVVNEHEQARPLGQNPQVQTALWERLRRWIQMLGVVQQHLESCQKQIDELFDKVPQAEIYRSMPGVGARLAPRLACLFGSKPQETFVCKAQASAYFGQSPVMESTGGKDKSKRKPTDPKKGYVYKRTSCNRFARHTCFLWSRSCAMARGTTWQKDYLKKHQQQGDQRGTRYRKLGKKQIAILYRCLVTNQCYNEDVYCKNRHQSSLAA